MERLWKERLIVEGYGRFPEVNNFCAECRSISLPREHGQGRYEWMPLEKNKKEYKVSGNTSLPYREVFEQVKRNADTDCYAQIMRRACNAKEVGQLGKVQRRIQE